MNKALCIIALLVAAIIAYFLWRQWDAETNHGHEFGYYGEFNRVSNAVASIPGIQVVDYMINRDVTMEEFGFDLRKSSGEVVRIGFGEQDPIRKLKGKELTDALKKQIDSATVLSTGATNPPAN